MSLDDATARVTLAGGGVAPPLAATIYVQYLYPVRREQVADILVSLLADPHPDIARQALHTIDVLTQDPDLNATQAASRIIEMKTNTT